ncbi:MAG: hypothetical protein NVSMB62_28630 [Acidobacteriaceae bacterium]
MKLIFLYGLPATGKFTVAKELAARTGFRLFHNHLAVDLLLSVFDFGSEPFVSLREQIWLSVFTEAARSGLPGLIFTFAPEPTVRSTFIDQAIQAVLAERGQIEFVELVCPVSDLKARMNAPSRSEFRKLTSVPLFEQLHASGAFDSSHMPRPKLTIDTSRTAPTESAARIAQALELYQGTQSNSSTHATA